MKNWYVSPSHHAVYENYYGDGIGTTTSCGVFGPYTKEEADEIAKSLLEHMEADKMRVFNEVSVFQSKPKSSGEILRFLVRKQERQYRMGWPD